MTDLQTLSLHRRVRQLLAPWAELAGPGMTVGVIQDGALLLHESAGLASIELGVAIDRKTCFRIASVSKQFTCAAVLLLAAEGRLDVEDSARRYLPELPEWGEQITVAQLMHNTAGVRDMLEIMRQGGVDLGQPCTHDDLMAGICRQRTLNFAPGSRFLYSNANFLLLGRIIERVSGELLAEFLQRHIFVPLGMSHTAMVEDTRRAVPNLATGYLPQPDGFIRAPHAFPLGGEGGLVSCVEDLALWERNFVHGRVGGTALGTALTAQAPFSNGVPNGYARGLMLRDHRGVATVSHGGLWPGYKTEFLRAPELGIAVIAIANHGGSDPNLLAHRVLDLLVEDRPELHPVPPMPPAADLAKLVGRWINREDGATLDISIAEDGAPVFTAGGVPIRPEPDRHGRLVASRGATMLMLRPLQEGTVEVEADAGRLSVLHRTEAGAALPEGLIGRYVSDEMAATWDFVEHDGTMQVEVSGPLLRGGTWSVEAIEADDIRVWVPGLLFRGWFDVRLRRDATGAVAGLVVNTNRLKDVQYARVPALE